MVSAVSVPSVTACVIIFQIWPVIALRWKNISTQIIKCEHEKAELIWEYELDSSENIKVKEWFTGLNESARRIALWIDNDGLNVSSTYKDRVTMIGNDSLILGNVTTRDEGTYTLIVHFRRSSQQNPRLTLNLTVLRSPLEIAGCCKPDIKAALNELHAFLHSDPSCGKPLPILNWTMARNKTVQNDRLILGTDDKAGTYKVYLTGPAVDTCFTGEKEDLCKSYTVAEESPPERIQLMNTLSTAGTIGVSVAVAVVLILIAAIVTVIIVRRWKRHKKAEMRDTERDLKSFTGQLISFYKTKLSSFTADSNLRYKMDILDHNDNLLLDSSAFVPNSYESILRKPGQVLNRILLQGNAGCGKKTWSNSFIRSWCQAHSGADEGQADVNINFLRNFRLLFSVSLSNVKREETVNALLKGQNIPGFENQGDIYEYLEQCSDVIFLIQDIDENAGDVAVVRELLTDTRLNNALLIFISTPFIWKLLQGKFKKDLTLNRTITITGLDENDIKEHANKILKKSGYPHDSMDKCFALIDAKNLGDFKKDPFFSPLLIKMWQKSNTLPTGKAKFLMNVLENLIKRKGSLFLSKFCDKNNYRGDFGDDPVFMGKVFIGHYGQILMSLGKIAYDKLIQHDETDVFESNRFEDANTCDFFVSFCLNVDLVCRSNSTDNKLHFRHRSIQLFLAALYHVFQPKQKGAISGMCCCTDDKNNFRDSAESEEITENEFLEYVSYLSGSTTGPRTSTDTREAKLDAACIQV